ncbi:MAG: transketolase [Pseudomonadota bacterium]
MPSRLDLANAIRALSMDAVQKANSGHPGAPMGMADIAEVVWNDFLSHNPANPQWHNRDRFVLSNGHASMLIYSLLHLTGYDLSLDDLRAFRQMGSRTAGHPEYGLTPGVETTTGPLGQGLANAVGMALCERSLADRYNRPGFTLIDHYTWVFAGDGCLMEGISHEACSLAGTQGLGKLICFYDDNGISIDGEVEGWFTDDTGARFEAYGWHVVRGVDGHDAEAIARATREAQAETSRPSLIMCRTIIGKGSPNRQNTADAHGAPLGDEEIALVREALGWAHAPFEIPDDIRGAWDARDQGAARESAWEATVEGYAAEHPALYEEFKRRVAGKLPEDWAAAADGFIAEAESKAVTTATRKASKAALDAFGPLLPELLGGSADLTGSNGSLWNGCTAMTPETPAGNYVYYGVREFGMSAMVNGMALYGGFKPYCATFLTFSDYARNALRMAALMKAPSIFVYTHDSVGLGEDGPTHQPVEHLASLRIMPGMTLWRPCDTVESLVAWRDALERQDGPSTLVFTRQGLPHQPRSDEQLANVRRGGYVLKDCDGVPDVILIATGSEVALAMDSASQLADDGVAARVVSMPCTSVFDAQSDAYRESVLPSAVTRRLAVEAGVPDGWYKYVGGDGAVVGLSQYGESAPAGEVFKHFGFEPAAVAARAKALL